MKRKKIFYVPGLISLLGIPLLLLLYPPEDKPFYTCFKVFLPTDKDDSPAIISFSKKGFYKTIEKKKVLSLDFESNFFPRDEMETARSQMKRDLIVREMEKMAFSHDTNTVIKVDLGYFNTLGDFVWLHDLSVFCNLRRYAFVDDSYLFLANTPPTPEPAVKMDSFAREIILDPNYRKPTRWDFLIWRIHREWQEIEFSLIREYVLPVGFLLLIVIPTIWKMKKYGFCKIPTVS